MSNCKFTATIFTLFPEIFPGSLSYSVSGRAMRKNLYSLNVINMRDFATDSRGTVDDYPYGGGCGMIIRPDIVANALESQNLNAAHGPIWSTSPRGEKFSQRMAEEVVSLGKLSIICGRYEGIDQRVINAFNIREISIGDYVLSGGEIAALAILDVCVRIIDGTLGNINSITNESFSSCNKMQHLLECDQYTRPVNWRGMTPPEVLLSGNHQAIERWRLENSEHVTRERRPDLWEMHNNEGKK